MEDEFAFCFRHVTTGCIGGLEFLTCLMEFCVGKTHRQVKLFLFILFILYLQKLTFIIYKHTTKDSKIILYCNANKNMHMLIKVNLHHENLNRINEINELFLK